tara:strand:- start:797 stop:1678 length:882 start_codon:yes stop_codon:yes gene_type:complete
MSLIKKAFSGILNTKDKIKETFSRISLNNSLNQDDYNSIEECLIESDVSWKLTEKIINEIKENYKKNDNWQFLLKDSIKKSIFNLDKITLKKIIIIIGVNGSGKTTTSAKLSYFLKKQKKEITLVAADTFRAAAVNQLKIWSERINVNFISNINSSDPASIAYDGSKSGIAKNHDHVIVDTAGRLHTSVNLMNELEKIIKVISKLTEDISVVMTLDANVGQNAIKQVQEFNKYIPIEGIIINKMDGSAKGGALLSIMHELKIPILFNGIGEKIEDFIEFDFNKFLESMIEVEK